jgi:hypothetical protein
LVKCGGEIRVEERRVQNAKECASLFQDLVAAELIVKKDASYRRSREEDSTGDSPTGKYLLRKSLLI